MGDDGALVVEMVVLWISSKKRARDWRETRIYDSRYQEFKIGNKVGIGIVDEKFLIFRSNARSCYFSCKNRKTRLQGHQRK